MTDGVVGTGHPDPKHPSNQHQGDAAKLVDYTGNPVVSQKPWSAAKTGLYISIGLSRTKPTEMKYPEYMHARGKTNLHLWPQGTAWVFIATSEGVPRWSTDVWGASLELPDDLGRDKLKQQYVMEWMRETLAESLTHASQADAFTGFTNHRVVGQWIYETSNKAINEIGL